MSGSILCPKCGHDTRVTDSRGSAGKKVGKVWVQPRRRACIHCGHRFNTVECTENDMIDLLSGNDMTDRVAAAIIDKLVDRLQKGGVHD